MSCQQMDFPETFDEFAESYGFRDKEEIYTNGAELIPVFRVKQWLQHIQKPTRMVDKSNFSMEQYREDTDCAYDCGYNKGFKDGIKSMSDKPCEDCVSRKGVVEILTDIDIDIDMGEGYDYDKWRDRLEELPSVYPARIKAKWEDKQYLIGSASAECSYCHKGTSAKVHDNGFGFEYIFPNICPHCGADMRGNEND